ncbi:MAG: ATP-binding protein [Alteromonadaceae bacterium]|uniref:ATP-binding protein n=1 Tax=Alteromonas mediterranea TaxID=314275 RepID=UPI000C4DE692|nr:ATP-binding protein [Alteromonadaceae bacterium]MAJ69458.1 ATP-binding protein [Alteromonadaceae bacterium]
MSRPFIRGQVAIDSMRDNGFLSTAHALAELMDNSIQAGADRVELIAFEERSNGKKGGTRAIKRVQQIGVLDNGCGMSPETLQLALEFGASENRQDSNGIGKFGMGLPNSSISQCKRVDVWSWQKDNEVFHTYLDIDLIKDGELETIPDPEKREIPKELASACGEKLPPSGTLVVWSKLDRCNWVTGKSIFQHTQDIVGRMYRNFIADGAVCLRFKSAEYKGSLFLLEDEQEFLPNDPLYLMKKTSLPELPGEYGGEAMFELCGDCEQVFRVEDEHGIEHEVKITGSVIKKSVFDAIKATTSNTIGNTPWGKHAVKNMGLSVVRSKRELALIPDFISKDAQARGPARFYGIQVEFSPSLDNIFGVTNNKQHVVHFKNIKASEDFEREGFESEEEYKSDLKASNDPKLKIYEIVRRVKEVEKQLLARISELGTLKGTLNDVSDEISESINSVTTKANRKEREREEFHPTIVTSITQEELEKELETIGVENPKEKAETILDKKLQVWVEELPMATSAFFDVSTKKGFTLLQINSNHVFSREILQKIPDTQREALEVCLAGWARMERECTSDKRLVQLQMARRDWGQLLDDYLDTDESEYF